MYAFNFVRPGTLAEAVKAIKAADDGKLMAGGQSLIPTLKQRLAKPSDVIDLNGLKDLAAIKLEGGQVYVGALTRHSAVAGSPIVQKAIPALADLAEAIGDPQVRNRGTLGGSLANSDPAADYPAGVLGLGATIHTSERTIAADDYFKGLFETALKGGEIITAVSFPVPEKAAYAKFPNPASRYAVVGVFVAKIGGGVRVAITGAGACAFRQKEMEAALAKSLTPAALDGIKISTAGLNNDIHASAEYRAHLIGVMAKRAVAKIAG